MNSVCHFFLLHLRLTFGYRFPVNKFCENIYFWLFSYFCNHLSILGDPELCQCNWNEVRDIQKRISLRETGLQSSYLVLNTGISEQTKYLSFATVTQMKILSQNFHQVVFFMWNMRIFLQELYVNESVVCDSIYYPLHI